MQFREAKSGKAWIVTINAEIKKDTCSGFEKFWVPERKKTENGEKTVFEE